MAEVVIMPKLGFNMDKGTLMKWYKKEGETVSKGEPLFEITTDKTNIDVEATLDGVVRKILVEVGLDYDVFTPVAIIGSEDEDISGLLEGANVTDTINEEPVSGLVAETEAAFSVDEDIDAELVIMPKLGFNMDKGTLMKWYKKEGETISKGESFFEITTDKTNIDVEATRGGVVRKILAEEGQDYDVFIPVAIIGSEDADISVLLNKPSTGAIQVSGVSQSQAKEAVVEETKATVASKKTVDLRDRKLTPRAKKYIKENNLDISTWNIVGTGYENGITEVNIKQYMEENKVRITPVAKKLAEMEGIDVQGVTGSGVQGKIIKGDIQNLVNKDVQVEEVVGEFTSDGKEITEKVSYAGVRKIIGVRLSESKFTSPHVYFRRSVDLTKLLALRKEINETQDKKTSVTDYIIMAAKNALQKYPDMNAALIGNEIQKYKSVNIGLAVAADNGLIVPVIKEVQKKSLVEVSNNSSALVKKARDGKLVPGDYTGGTFTISNLGMFGIEDFTAIINPPESGILAVSATERKPVVIINENGEERIRIRPMMNITLSVDHRIIDGLLAAQVVGEIKAQLENPIGVLL